jgi:hypothetical protein
MLLMTLQFIDGSEDPYGIVATLLDALPSGSYLVASHPARDDSVGVANAATAKYNQMVSTKMTRRTRSEVAAFFTGLELLEPGIVHPAQWRPGDDPVDLSVLSPAYCGVARKP